MDGLKENIDKQIKFNQDKNIFRDDLEMFRFADETVKAISDLDSLAPGSKRSLIDYAVDKVIEEFYRVNQYYSFDLKAKEELRKIYAALMESLQNKTVPLDDISKNHYKKIKEWLKKSNPFAEKIYRDADQKIEPVACSEYNQDLQVHILKLDIEQILQPVLDIGCGSRGLLVRHLRDQGVEAYGIDRLKFTTGFLFSADWLEYDYGRAKWGTIVSNLGFSNHFNHHNLRADGNFIGYAQAYMRILHALVPGGSFHYAPDLPFIEQYLDPNQFTLQKYKIADNNFMASVVKRLS